MAGSASLLLAPVQELNFEDSDSDESIGELEFDTSGKKQMLDSMQMVMDRDLPNNPAADVSAFIKDSSEATGREAYAIKCRLQNISLNQDVIKQLGSSECDMCAMALRGVDGVAIGASMPYNRIVKELYLENNRLSDSGCEALCIGLSGNNSVSVLSLAFNEITWRSGETLGQLLINNNAIQVLNMEGNRLGDQGCVTFSPSLAENDTVTELNISNNRISCRGGDALSSSLANNKSITDLDISYNCFRPSQMAKILNSLVSHQSLRILSAGWNGFGVDGSLAMANLIKSSPGLTALDSSNCRVDCSASAMAAIADSVASNGNLKALRFDGNHLGDNARLLLRSVEKHDSIELLSMNDCGFDPEGFVDYNEHNTSGHFKLDLSMSKEQAIAKKLAKHAIESLGECFRNEKVEGQRFYCPKDGEWTVPSSGMFEVDFIDLRQDSSSIKPMDRKEFAALNKQMRANATDIGRMALLRTVCNTHHFDALQALALVLFFSFDRQRENACVVLWQRIIDRDSLPPLLASSLSDTSIVEVQKRIGTCALLDRARPSGAFFVDLAKQRDMVSLNRILEVVKENEEVTISSLQHNGADVLEKAQFLTSLPAEGELLLVVHNATKESGGGLASAIMNAKGVPPQPAVRVETTEWSVYTKSRSRPSSAAGSRPSSSTGIRSRPGSSQGGFRSRPGSSQGRPSSRGSR